MAASEQGPRPERWPGQNIPLPLGGVRPARAGGRRRRFPWRRVRGAAVVLAALCAVAGVALLIGGPPVSASLDGAGVNVGSMSLARVPGPGTSALFRGDASLELDISDGAAHAASAWTRGGRVSTGVCDMRSEQLRLVATCTFSGSAGTITAVDVLDTREGSSWQRTYADGQHVSIDVPPDGGAIPVPFPVGRTP